MTTTAISELGRGHLATLMHEIRPDWHIAGCVAALRKIDPSIPAAAIAIAAMRYAVDENNLTPAHLADFGNRAWDSDGYPPCPVHGHTPRRPTGECRDCWADRIAVDGPPAPRKGTPPPCPLRELVGDTRPPATPTDATTGATP